jgi:glycosyltransferase involved in cell wall biosynthesis
MISSLMDDIMRIANSVDKQEIKYKVSCIMPTSSKRKAFIKQAVESFKKQDYKNEVELIILDSDKSINIPFPDCMDIRHFTDLGNLTIGKKRNLGCIEATGDVILHMDDDDWYATDWITKSVAALGEHEMTGLSSLYFFKPETNLWLYRYPLHEKPWVAGATMCYKRSFWENNPFDESVKYGEDNNFVWKSKDVAPHGYMEGFCSMIHNGNTSPKITTDPAWIAQPVSLAKNILKEDYQKYISLLGTEAVKP